MKKIILTLTVMAFAIQGFSQDYMFDKFLKEHEEVGPKLAPIMCEIEDLTRQILVETNIEKQQEIAVKIRKLGDSLRNDIGRLRRKNSVSCNDYTMGLAVASATGNIALAPAYAMLYETEEEPNSKYYSLVNRITHLAWRVSKANSTDKVEKKTEEMIEVINSFNIYHAK